MFSWPQDPDMPSVRPRDGRDHSAQPAGSSRKPEITMAGVKGWIFPPHHGDTEILPKSMIVPL